MPDPTPKPPVPGVGKRQARNRRRDGSHTPSAVSDRERFEKARADHKELSAAAEKIRLERERGELIEAATIAGQVRAIGEEIKSLLFARDEELAVENAGLSADVQLTNNRRSTLTLLARWREFAAKHGAKE